VADSKHLVPNGLLRGRTFCGLRVVAGIRYALAQRGWSYFSKSWCSTCRVRHAALRVRARAYRRKPLLLWTLALCVVASSGFHVGVPRG